MSITQPNTTLTSRSRSKRTALASAAAIGSVLGASSCCLPVLPFVFAAGLAGSSSFLAVLRPYLLVLAAAFIAYGFFQSWQAKKCNSRPGVLSSILLWGSAGFVVASIFFPQVLADAAAGLLVR
jgi:hypothetical protein